MKIILYIFLLSSCATQYILESSTNEVIPVNIDGTQNVLPPGVSWPRRGTVNIRHGDPLFAKEDESSSEFTKRIEDAIAALRPEGESA